MKTVFSLYISLKNNKTCLICCCCFLTQERERVDKNKCSCENVGFIHALKKNSESERERVDKNNCEIVGLTLSIRRKLSARYPITG